jgi:hypothetical protein
VGGGGAAARARRTAVSGDRFARWRGTPLWDALEAALTRVEGDGLLSLAEDAHARDAVVGHLCAHLDAEGMAAGTRLAAVRATLAGAGWRSEDYRDNLALELCALIERGGGVGELAAYTRRFADDLSTLGVGGPPVADLAALAADVLAAYGQGGGAVGTSTA